MIRTWVRSTGSDVRRGCSKKCGLVLYSISLLSFRFRVHICRPGTINTVKMNDSSNNINSNMAENIQAAVALLQSIGVGNLSRHDDDDYDDDDDNMHWTRPLQCYAI
jgi:hypothetical protein